MKIDRDKLPFAALGAPVSDKPSLPTLTEESLATSRLITSQLATSVDVQKP